MDRVSGNMMLGTYANYNKGNPLAAQLMLTKSERVTDPKENEKTRCQAIRLN
jgi:hypothetical protein